MNKSYDTNNLPRIEKEKFEFVNRGERISDKKFDDKPVGYFKDAWIRFRKNKGSVVAAIIILCIVAFSFLCPLLTTNFDAAFMDVYYAKKPPRNMLLSNIGIADGGTNRDFSEKSLVKAVAIGMAVIARAAAKCGLCDADAAHRLINALQAHGLPTDNPYAADRLLEAAMRDKKRRGDRLTLIVPRTVGDCMLHDIAVDDLAWWITEGSRDL